MRFWLAFVAFGVLALSCRKTSSKAFYEAQSQYEIVAAREGEEAYLSGQLEPIVAKLNSVETGAQEYASAQALVQKIAAETARLKAEQLARNAVEPAAAAGDRPSSGFASGSAKPEVPEPADATPARDAGSPFDNGPQGNMSAEAFAAQYKSCVKRISTGALAASTKSATGRGQRETFEVVASAECKKKLRADDDGVTQFEFVDNELKTRTVLEVKTVERVVDAGAPTVTTTETGRYVPGMPSPESAPETPNHP